MIGREAGMQLGKKEMKAALVPGPLLESPPEPQVRFRI